MIGNKYGKVIVIILINIVAICFVYNNVTSDEVSLVHRIASDEDAVKNVEDELNHGKVKGKNNDNNEKNNMPPVTKESREHPDRSDAKTTVSAKKVIETKNGAEETNSAHDTVMLMKNLLSIQVEHRGTPKTTPNPPEFVRDGELEKKLEDSGEIDLSPPKPTLISSHTKLQNLESFKQLMMDRSNLLKKKCSTKGNSPSINSNWMYVLESRSLVWCPVYKAASTNWMHNLLHLAGKKEEEIERIKRKHPGQPNDQGRVVAPITSFSHIKSISRGEDARLLLIVRHPFDRLVSAFRDKLEQCHGPSNCTLGNNWYYKQYSKNIVARYRSEALRKFGSGFFSKENNFGAPLPVARSWRSADMPSWWEFVQYLLNTSPSSYDEHWKPASMYCGVCSFPYNRILHFENIENEEKFFAEEMNASDLIHPRWENRNDEGLAKEDILSKYFDLLDDEEVEALYEIYKDDFLMFGYQFKYKHFRFNVHS